MKLRNGKTFGESVAVPLSFEQNMQLLSMKQRLYQAIDIYDEMKCHETTEMKNFQKHLTKYFRLIMKGGSTREQFQLLLCLEKYVKIFLKE